MSEPRLLVQTGPCDALTVMYDGACPLCRREIGLYQSLTPLQTEVWLEVSDMTASKPYWVGVSVASGRLALNDGARRQQIINARHHQQPGDGVGVKFRPIDLGSGVKI